MAASLSILYDGLVKNYFNHINAVFYLFYLLNPIHTFQG